MVSKGHTTGNRRVRVTLAALAAVALFLYLATLARFGAMLGN